MVERYKNEQKLKRLQKTQEKKRMLGICTQIYHFLNAIIVKLNSREQTNSTDYTQIIANHFPIYFIINSFF